MRFLSGQNGKIAKVTDAKIMGCFAWSATDPNGNGDDGGLVLASKGSGFWVRQWTYGPRNPIELDWFELSDRDNITDLIDDVAAAYKPNFYVRMPSTSMTLLVDDYWDFTCAGHGITRFRLLESSAIVTLKWSGVGTRSYMIVLGNSLPGQPSCNLGMLDVVVGTDVDKNDRDAYNLWLDGSIDGPCANCTEGNGIVHVKAEATGNINAQFRYNVRDALSSALYVQGTPSTTIYVSGRYESGSLRASRVHVVIDDTLYTSDPYARNWGWTGDVKNGVALIDYYGSRYGTKYGSHNVGNSFGSLASLKGVIYMDYDNAPWGLFLTEFVGEEGRPFTLISKNSGFLGDGTPVEPPNVPSHWGKSDPMSYPGSTPTPGRRFIKFVDEGSDYGEHLLLMNGTWFEATDETCRIQGGRPVWHNTYIDVTLVNFKDRSFRTAVNLYCGGDNPGLSEFITIRTDGINPGMLNDKILIRGNNHTIDGGQWSGIHVQRASYYGQNQPDMPCNNATIRDARVTWTVEVDRGCKGTRLSNVEWLGKARTVMEIGANTSVTADNIKAPAGSTVEGSGTLILNGEQVALPYTFDGSEGTGSSTSNQAPVAHNQSITLDAGQKKLITLKGSDADGDAISYSIAGQPAHGTLSGSAPNVAYEPNAGFSGNDIFTFTVHDGSRTSNTATVSITVRPAPSPTDNVTEQHFELKRGWNNVSFHVRPEDSKISSVLSQVGPNLVLAKDEEGRLYYPEAGIDELGTWELEEAYYLYVDENTIFSVAGEPIPATTPIPLNVGWNYVPYILDHEMPVADAFGSIESQLVLAKDQEGRTFIPEMGITEFNTLVPGEGYQVYTEGPTTLVYVGRPLAHWSFEGTGETITDETGQYPGALQGAVRTASGYRGSALAFDGEDDYVDLGTMDIPGSAMTISVWFNADDFDDVWSRIISKAKGTDDDDHWWMLGMIEEDGSPRVRFRLKTDGVTTAIVGNQPISAQEWVHVAARYDGSKMELFLNGEPAGGIEKTGSISTDSTIPVYLGKNPFSEGQYFFHGRIDELKIFDRALTDEELLDLFEDTAFGA